MMGVTIETFTVLCIFEWLDFPMYTVITQQLSRPMRKGGIELPPSILPSHYAATFCFIHPAGNHQRIFAST